MTLISPNRHLQSVPVRILFTQSAGGNRMAISFTGELNKIYPGKPLQIAADSGYTFEGTYVQNDDGDFIDFVAGTYMLYVYGAATIRDTFETNNKTDNENVTMRDIMVNGLGTRDAFTGGKLTKRGKPGIVTGSDILKLSRRKLPVRWGQTVNYSNSAIAMQQIGIVRFDRDELTDGLEHTFTMVNEFIDLKFSISFARTGVGHADTNGYVTSPFTFECQQFSTYGDRNLVVTLEAARQYTGVECLSILARFQGIDDDSAAVPVQVNHYITDRARLLSALPPTDGSATSIGNFCHDVLPDATNGQLNYTQVRSTAFAFANGGTSAYTQNGPIRNTPIGLSAVRPVKIAAGTDINTVCFPGWYHCHVDADVTAVTNLPAEVVNRFNLEVLPLLGTYAVLGSNRQVAQRLTTWVSEVVGGTTFLHSATWERISSVSAGIMTWSAWEKNGKKVHTHTADDISETTARNFVSQTEIDTWNSLLEKTTDWANHVATFAELTGPNGTTQFVTATGLFYTKIAGVWTPTSANCILDAAANQKGLVTLAQFAKWDKVAMARQAGNADSFVYYNNLDSLYGAAFAMLPNLSIDLVKRTVPLSTPLGVRSLNFGFDDTQANGIGGIAIGTGTNVSGDNAIGIGSGVQSSFARIIAIGSGLLVDKMEVTALGRFNTSFIPNDYSFIVGNGTADAARSNLFAVRPDGIFDAGGYSVVGKDDTSVLTAGGGTSPITDIIAAAIQSFISSYIMNKRVIGDLDGVNVAFTLPDMPVAGKVKLYFNGQLLYPSKSPEVNDYTIVGKDITMSLDIPPTVDDTITSEYIIDTTYIAP